jgi:uncharacterized protein (DUF58 family)
MPSFAFWKPNFLRTSYWRQWFRVAKSKNNIALLSPRQIYILPTRWGILYAIMLLLLLVGSINYSISLGYYITFLLTSLGNMVMLQTWRNLVHLQISTLPAEPVFAGNITQVPIQLTDTRTRARYAVAAQFEGNTISYTDIANNNSSQLTIAMQTQQRGWQTLPRIQLHTEFPMALLHAWAYVENPQQVLVYPKPSENDVIPPTANDAQSIGINHAARGDDDFDGHKTYQVGDAASRVDWKASSRGIGMFSKQYSGNGSATLLLDWAATEGEFEARISQLTRWVVDAHAAQLHFGLALPNFRLAPNNNEAHYHQALCALATL